MQILGGIRYGNEIASAALAHGLDPKLLAAVAAQETGGPGQSSGNNVVGDGGHGHGVFQIDDRSWGFALTAAAMDPAANADKAASILADDLGRYGGDVHKALSAYNSGSPTATGTTTTWGDGQTLGYADSVLRHYVDLGGSAGLAATAPAATAGAPAPGGTDMLAALVADQATNSASVNGLSSASAALSAASMDSLPSPTTPTQSALRSWASIDQGAGNPAAGADAALANLVDPADSDESDDSDS